MEVNKTQIFKDIERYVERIRFQAIGWAHIFCCTKDEKGTKPGDIDLAEMVEQAKKDLKE